jgi:transcriptional regulator with XRE-family HTH domain
MSTKSTTEIAARIRNERLRLGWTQADTAVRAGVSDRNYRRFERLGRTSLDQFVRIAGALGLGIELAAVADTAPTPDPRSVHPRQRGVRHSRPKPAPATKPSTKVSPPAQPAAPAVPKYHPAAPSETMPESDPDVVKEYQDSINRLVAVIVRNTLTNWTAAQVARNAMASNAVPDGQRPAWIGGVLAKLAQLSPDNLAQYGCRPAEFEAWRSGWHFDEPIHGALD